MFFPDAIHPEMNGEKNHLSVYNFRNYFLWVISHFQMSLHFNFCNPISVMSRVPPCCFNWAHVITCRWCRVYSHIFSLKLLSLFGRAKREEDSFKRPWAYTVDQWGAVIIQASRVNHSGGQIHNFAHFSLTEISLAPWSLFLFGSWNT